MDPPQARAVRGRHGDLARRPRRADRSRQGDRRHAETVTAAEGGDRGELAQAIAHDAVAEARERKNPLGGFRPSKGATAGVEILDELREVNRVLEEKAGPEDATAVREWLLAAAQEAANAAKEGGFMGFHAERVSQGEQDMLDRLREVLAAFLRLTCRR
jgi:hypothetical protein